MSSKTNSRGRSSRRLYWLCQLGGWSALALLQLLFELAINPTHTRLWVAVAVTSLPAASGFLATHLLHLQIRKRQLLEKPWIRVTLQLGVAILLMAAPLDAIDLLAHHALMIDSARPATMNLVIMVLNWGNWIVILLAWTGLYVASHELRERQHREVQSLRVEMIAQQAQLRGLRAQLNPHFFFNCLNSVREMIAEDPQRAQLMVTQLSQLLRYSLQSDEVELVSFGEEIRAVQDYLALETTRFEERLHISWNIAPEALSRRFPPMILQTLVENAVKHGIACRPGGGEIAIAARVDTEEFQVEVINSGNLSEERSAAGVGLRNASERLSLLYGPRAHLLLESTPDSHVRALVRVPILMEVCA
jgi:two-component system sensor histidine kinase AlgZ